MIVRITIVLDVGEQDSTKDAIEIAENQIREMDGRDIVNMAEFQGYDN